MSAGRIRTIKPEFAESESIGKLSRDARLLFLQLLTVADDEGRLRAAPRLLAGKLYPYDDDAPSLIEGWLAELDANQHIIRYAAGGNHYAQITNWAKHQKIDRPSKSKLPSPDQAEGNEKNPEKSTNPTTGREDSTKAREASTNARECSRGFDAGPWTLDHGPRTYNPPLPPQGDGGGEFTPEPDQPHLAEQTEPQRVQNQRLPLNIPKDSPENIQYPDPDFPEKPPKSFTDMADAVWASYPETRGTKGHKAKAFAALSAAIRRGGTGPPEWVAEARRIAAAVARYRAFCEATGQKNKDAFRWLKDGNYDQDYRIPGENRQNLNHGAAYGRQNYPNKRNKQDEIEQAARDGLRLSLEAFARRSGIDAGVGNPDGDVPDDECFWEGAGVIEGDYTVVSE